MNEVVPFSFEDQEVRVVTREGEPWWVLTDVCRVLGIANARDAASRLDHDEKGVGSIDTPGGQQQSTIINESGLYSLVLTSRRPEAKRFKKWVTSEVLPAIRKTGGFGAPPAPAPPLDLRDPLQLARAAAQLVEINSELQQEVRALTSENAALASEKEDLALQLREGSLGARELAALSREVRRATEALGVPTSKSPPSMVADHLSIPEILDEMRVPITGRKSLNHDATRQLRDQALKMDRMPIMDPQAARPLFHQDVVRAWRQEKGNDLVRDHLKLGQLSLPNTTSPDQLSALMQRRRSHFQRWMDANNLTPYQVAKRSRVSLGSLYDFLRGRSQSMTAVKEQVIAEAFGLPASTIFG